MVKNTKKYKSHRIVRMVLWEKKNLDGKYVLKIVLFNEFPYLWLRLHCTWIRLISNSTFFDLVHKIICAESSIEWELVGCQNRDNVKNILPDPSFMSEFWSSGSYFVRLEAIETSAAPRVNYLRGSSVSLIQLSCFSMFSCAGVHIPWMFIPEIRAAQRTYQPSWLFTTRLTRLSLSKCYVFVLQFSLKGSVKTGDYWVQGIPSAQKRGWKFYHC